MDRPQFLKSIVNWLREGYPNGVPSGDYIPLVALLRRQLTDDEVKQISRSLIDDGQVTTEGPEPISRIDAGVLVTKVTDELPFEADIKRISDRLAVKGWPFDAEPLAADADSDSANDTARSGDSDDSGESH